MTAETLEKFGRRAWVGYLTLSFPLAVFCLGADLLVIHGWFNPDPGPLDAPSPSWVEVVFVGGSVFLLPVFWILGAWLGHRFNGGWKSVIPFVAHFLVLAGLAWGIGQPRPPEEKPMPPLYLYPAFLAPLVMLGLAAALVAACCPQLDRAQSSSHRDGS